MPIDQYAVMGNPISHSKSPLIHAFFAKQTQQKISYEAILVPLQDFPDAVHRFFQKGGKGLNITLPFKQEAWQLADTLSPRAKLANAVNTLILDKNGQVIGDNTDGVGLARDLKENKSIQICGKRLLIIGAGGAVRGVIGSLLAENPRNMVIANRTLAKAESLVKEMQFLGPLTASSFENLSDEKFDIVINGTAASLTGQVPAIPEKCLNTDTCCYDMVFSEKPTAFQVWAKTQGIQKNYDGMGMLIEQAAESFYLWRGVRPDTSELLAQKREVKTS